MISLAQQYVARTADRYSAMRSTAGIDLMWIVERTRRLEVVKRSAATGRIADTAVKQAWVHRHAS